MMTVLERGRSFLVAQLSSIKASKPQEQKP